MCFYYLDALWIVVKNRLQRIGSAVHDNCVRALEWARNTWPWFFQCDFTKAVCLQVLAELLKIQRWNAAGAAGRSLL